MMGRHSRKLSRLLAALLGCVAAALAAPAAQAAGKTVYFLSWGGTIQTMLEKEGWADEFKKDTGYEVTLVPKVDLGGDHRDRDRPEGQAAGSDAVMCDHPAWVQGLHQGIFAAVDQESVPNLADLYPIAPIKEDGKTMGVYAWMATFVRRPLPARGLQEEQVGAAADGLDGSGRRPSSRAS